MSNHAIVQIGGSEWLCPSIEAGAKLVGLLGKCVQMDSDYEQRDGLGSRYVYSPRDAAADRQTPVELKIVSSDQIRKPIARVPKGRRLGFTPTLDPAP